MPTPVATARQCLTEEAARALDDAVSVAKRRNHAQTSSLHAVSALLSPSFTLLRESLSRSRSSAYSPRLQLRALELCVGVSLDRQPTSKSHDDDFAPPVSNSLMAAIRRSQANQRRQPEMYHLNQIHLSNNNNGCSSPISISSIRVELKHFVLSILDDPIVSRVFGEAGFRSTDIKFAIIHPPLPSLSRRCPPLFLCNFMDFPGYFDGDGGSPAAACGRAASAGGGGGDENCRRIGEVMVKTRERNPLLVGVCAKDALASFKECVSKGRFSGFPAEIHGLNLVCFETEIRDSVDGKSENEGLDLKLKEVRSVLESDCSGPGVVVNLGELKVLVDDHGGHDHDAVNQLVVKLSGLIEVYGKKLWLIGTAANYETYSNFVRRFPSIERDWDLHPLPITSSRSSFERLSSKPSLMGSFVPFGGFFPTPSDFRNPLVALKQPFTRCNSCNNKYEQELSAMPREGSSVSVADQHSATLPSWLQRAESDMSKREGAVAQVKDVKTASNEKISHLQKKWDDHCRHVHQSSTFASPGVSLARLQVPQPLGFHHVADKEGSSNSSGDSSLNERACSNSSSGMQIVAQNISPQQQVMKAEIPKRAQEISEFHLSGRERSASLTHPIRNLSLPLDHKLPSTVSVTTDLGLGTIYTSKCEELKKPFLQDRQAHLQHFPGSVSVNQGLDLTDYKSIYRKLSEAVVWQGEAISRITEIVSCCRSGSGRQRAANIRGNIWLSFHGPDKIGKKRIAEALADAMFGSKDRLIAVDLSTQDRISNVNSLFLCQGSRDFDINVSRVTVVDHIAQELSKKPHSVTFLENVDEADPLVQNSLSRAIQSGKFQDSRGREIGINNVVFVTTSSMTKDDKSLSPRKEFIKFLEENILEAKNWQMQIAIRCISGDASRSNETSVSLVPPKRISNQRSSTKRKLFDMSGTSGLLDVAKQSSKTLKNSLDLNLPLEDVEEAAETNSYEGDFLSNGSRAWLQDLYSQMDGNLVFKPFDFDALADKLLRKIRSNFEEALRGERISLEIDHEVMVQILAAAWSSDGKGAAEEWIEQVLRTSFTEARERYRFTTESVVRISLCEGVPVKEWSSSICLPKRINLCV